MISTILSEVLFQECLIGVCELLQTFLKSAEGLISQVLQSL